MMHTSTARYDLDRFDIIFRPNPHEFDRHQHSHQQDGSHSSQGDEEIHSGQVFYVINYIVNCTGQKYPFTFDKVFNHEVSQQDVFTEISQLVQNALDGYKVNNTDNQSKSRPVKNDRVIHGDYSRKPPIAENPLFLDPIQTGFLETQNHLQNLYCVYGNGDLGDLDDGNSGGVAVSGEMMLPYNQVVMSNATA
ncbi:hypothetical protein JHK84_043881 [Glycine max]|nr:hypothetical protein JHK84_043881 [Glycine max]